MILPSNYDEIDFDALYKAQKARSSFGKKFAADWDKKAPSFKRGRDEKRLRARIYRQGRFYGRFYAA